MAKTDCPFGVIDSLIDAQKTINQAQSELNDILSTPAGARLYHWSTEVQSTWWYRLFSRIDGTFKKRIARLS